METLLKNELMTFLCVLSACPVSWYQFQQNDCNLLVLYYIPSGTEYLGAHVLQVPKNMVSFPPQCTQPQPLILLVGEYTAIALFLIIQHYEKTNFINVFSIGLNVIINIKRNIFVGSNGFYDQWNFYFLVDWLLVHPCFMMASLVFPRECTHLYIILQW